MTTQETPPEWFRSIVLEATLWNARERHIDRLWYELSKPENLAKIPVVKDLIKFAEIYQEHQCVELDVLKPFKKEGSDDE